MLDQARHLRNALEDLIATEVQRLIAQADVCVFTLHDARQPDDPVDYRCYQRTAGMRALAVEVAFDYEGIGIWHVCRRQDETFFDRFILVEIRDGKFAGGQTDTFEGYWDEFPQYVAEGRWVRQYCLQRPAND